MCVCVCVCVCVCDQDVTEYSGIVAVCERTSHLHMSKALNHRSHIHHAVMAVHMF